LGEGRDRTVRIGAINGNGFIFLKAADRAKENNQHGQHNERKKKTLLNKTANDVWPKATSDAGHVAMGAAERASKGPRRSK
jgi:hypothetical protein